MSRRLTCWLAFVVVIAGFSPAIATAQPPRDPEARATWRAEWRAQHRADPVAQKTRRAEKWKEKAEEYENKPPKPMELRGPLPLPVDVGEAHVVIRGGKPAGGSCPPEETCRLKTDVDPGTVVVVTAAWSAIKLECDGVSRATPKGGGVVAPWWRCQESVVIEGRGAGWLGFTMPR